MERFEKIKLAIKKGITCNPETGEVFGVRGKVIRKKIDGYISITIYDNKKQYYLQAHQFVYYWVHKKCVECIDHINGVRDDNRILNIRSVTKNENSLNRVNAKGYTWHKRYKKWQSQIKQDGKSIYLGSFNTEEEARQAYLDAKK